MYFTPKIHRKLQIVFPIFQLTVAQKHDVKGPHIEELLCIAWRAYNHYYKLPEPFAANSTDAQKKLLTYVEEAEAKEALLVRTKTKDSTSRSRKKRNCSIFNLIN